MTNEEKLVMEINKYSNIIVYGAEMRGQCLVERIKHCLPQSTVSVAVSNTKGKIIRCGGLVAQNISDYAEMANDAYVVLIATREMFHDEIEKTARSFGFVNIIRITEQLFYDIQLKYDLNQIAKMQKNNQFLQYQTMNLIRLNHLREKVHLGQKIRVVFLLTCKARFNFASIYRAMEKIPIFEIILFVITDVYYYHNDTSTHESFEQMKLFANELNNKGFNVVWGYNENNDPIFIDTLKPDIIFYNICYFSLGLQECSPHKNNIRMCIFNTLSCFQPYAVPVCKTHEHYYFNNDDVFPAWLHFVGNRHEHALAANNSVTNGLHHVLSGYSVFDGYAEEPRDILPPKFRDKDKIIIYAPHWSMGMDYSVTSFHIFWKRMIALLKEHPNFGFVLKPHPNLSHTIKYREQGGERSQPTFEEWKDYCQTWEDSPNGIIVTDNSYIEWFRQSDCLITDSLSFISAWLPTEKPCIYLKNPAVPKSSFLDSFFDHIQPVLESYYLCDDEQTLKRLVEDVVVAGIDPKAEDRKRQIGNVVHNLGHAGEYIANYIAQQLGV